MVPMWGRLLLATTAFLLAAGVWAAGPPDDRREARWDLLDRGFTREYIEECLARRDQPGWSLEDEADLAMGYWWLMAEDFNNGAIQDQLFTVVESGIDRCRAAAGEESCPPEHQALMGNLITMASQVQVARGNYLSAARYAREGKKMLEQVRLASPEIGDTYFSLGLYLYYVDLSSPLVRSLQRILFFPPGDAQLGLQYLEKAALQSRRFGTMARVALATIYSNGENQHREALTHLRTLRRDYPENPLFLSLTAKILAKLGSFDQTRLLLDEADEKVQQGVPPYLEYHRNVFLIIRAEADVEDFALDSAYRALTTVMEDGSGPSWVRPVAAHSLARLYLLSGDEKSYSELLRRLKRADEDGRHRRRIKRLPGKLADDGYGPDLHQVFRYWISGDLDSAGQLLRRLKEIKGNSGLLSYLLGQVLVQRGEAASAREQFRDYLSLGSAVRNGQAAWSLIRLGDIEADASDFDAARNYYRQAESRDESGHWQVAVYRLERLDRREERQQRKDG